MPSQAPLTAEHLLQAFCCSCFLTRLHAIFERCRCLSIVVNVLRFYLLCKTPNRCGTQFHAGKLSIFIRSSLIDPIGDRNDVRELLLLFGVLGLCLLFFFLSNLYPHPIYSSPRTPRRRRWPKAVRAAPPRPRGRPQAPRRRRLQIRSRQYTMYRIGILIQIRSGWFVGFLLRCG